MKPSSLQNTLRVLIVAGSLGGFSSGWVLFAHAGKPVPEPPPIVLEATPQPLPDDLAPLDLQPLPALPQSPSFTMPRLRTRSS
jgi:hypothetical protein